MLRMQLAEALRDQHLDRLLAQLLARVAEHPFGLRIDEHDPPFVVDDDHRIRRGFDEPPEHVLGTRAVRPSRTMQSSKVPSSARHRD